MEGKGSTIAAYIRRFRGPPTSREERESARQDRTQDFWWVGRKTTSPERSSSSRGSTQQSGWRSEQHLVELAEFDNDERLGRRKDFVSSRACSAIKPDEIFET